MLPRLRKRFHCVVAVVECASSFLLGCCRCYDDSHLTIGITGKPPPQKNGASPKAAPLLGFRDAELFHFFPGSGFPDFPDFPRLGRWLFHLSPCNASRRTFPALKGPLGPNTFFSRKRSATLSPRCRTLSWQDTAISPRSSSSAICRATSCHGFSAPSSFPGSKRDSDALSICGATFVAKAASSGGIPHGVRRESAHAANSDKGTGCSFGSREIRLSGVTNS